MRKSKKALALVLALAMSVSCWGCGSDKSTSSDNTKSDDATVQPTVNTADISTDSNDKFYVYSWNDELGQRLDYFYDAYPQYKDRVEYVNTGGDDTYQEKIDQLLQTDGDDYPDMIAAEAGYIKKYTNSDYTLDVKSIGISDDDMANMYDYTKDVATSQVDQSIKGVSWQACPGAFTYRTDLAEKYLGVSDPDGVQEYVKDWDTFLETAKTINEKSGGATKMLSGADDVAQVYKSNKENAWVDSSSNFVIDDQILEYMDMYKTLIDEKLTNETSQWSEDWYANCGNDSTFAYFGCTWLLQWTIMANCGGEKVGEGTYGNWAMCQGPSTYYWGGTWLCATQNCSDTALAALIMKTLCCDTDTMVKICEETKDYVNNKAAVDQLVADGKGASDFLGGQDYLSMFKTLADGVDVSWMSAYDQKIDKALDVQVKAYADGSKDKDTAIKDLKAAVQNDYPDLNIE